MLGLLGCLSVALCCSTAVHGLSIDLPPGSQKCLGLDITAGSFIKAGFKVHDVSSATERTQVSFTITQPDGSIEYSASNTPEASHPFASSSDGTHQMCLRNTGGLVRRVSFTFDKDHAPKSEHDLAKKKDLEPAQIELNQLMLETDEIFNELHAQRDRDETFRELNDNISSKVMMYSLLSIAIMLGTAAWQVFHLKTFLRHIKVV